MTLIDRLSKLDGPDREVDAILWCLDNKLTFKKKLHHTYNGQPRFYSFRTAEKGTVGIGLVPKYTASVDACLTLADRVLPGHQVNVTHFHAGHGEASIGNRLIAKPSSGSNARHSPLHRPLARKGGRQAMK